MPDLLHRTSTIISPGRLKDDIDRPPGANMSEGNQPDDRSETDPELFDEWLDQAADSKGITKQEMMDQMLSSYWILDELAELVEGSRSGQGTDLQSMIPTDPATGTESDDRDDKPGGPEVIGESARQPSGLSEENIHDIQTVLRELLESQAAADPAESLDQITSDTVTIEQERADPTADLGREIETFESRLEDIEARQDQQFERLSDELQLVLDRIDGLERCQDQFAEAGDVDVLADKIRELGNQLEALQTIDSKLESRMEREFDSIEELFRRILDILDELEADLDTATESYRSELEPLQQREVERRQLEKLKTEALGRGVREGVCESCGRDVDLTLLESPECPDCTARFIGIGDSGWNPFRSPKLETEPTPMDET